MKFGGTPKEEEEVVADLKCVVVMHVNVAVNSVYESVYVGNLLIKQFFVMKQCLIKTIYL